VVGLHITDVNENTYHCNHPSPPLQSVTNRKDALIWCKYGRRQWLLSPQTWNRNWAQLPQFWAHVPPIFDSSSTFYFGLLLPL